MLPFVLRSEVLALRALIALVMRLANRPFNLQTLNLYTSSYYDLILLPFR